MVSCPRCEITRLQQSCVNLSFVMIRRGLVFQKNIWSNDRTRHQLFQCVVHESWHRVHWHAIQPSLDRFESCNCIVDRRHWNVRLVVVRRRWKGCKFLEEIQFSFFVMQFDEDKDGVVHTVTQAEGGEQGDAFVPALFAHGQHPAMQVCNPVESIVCKWRAVTGILAKTDFGQTDFGQTDFGQTDFDLCLCVFVCVGPPGFRTTARELQTCTFQGPNASKTPPKIHEKTPREGRKERILRRERKKKREILGPPTLRAPHPSGPPLRTPTFLHPPTSTQNTQKNLNNLFQKLKQLTPKNQKSLHTTETLTLAKVGLAQSRFGQSRFRLCHPRLGSIFRFPCSGRVGSCGWKFCSLWALMGGLA